MAKTLTKPQALMEAEQKLAEQELSIDLYINENIRLQKALNNLQERTNSQAAEILVFVDRVKQEKEETEAYLLKLETKLNESWGFIQELKDTMGDDSVVRSLLEKFFLDNEDEFNGYAN